jgi:hypothetical protein
LEIRQHGARVHNATRQICQRDYRAVGGLLSTGVK